MDKQAVEFFVSLGVGGVLAGLMFYFYHRDMKENRAALKGLIDNNQVMRDKVVELLEKNIECIATNTEVLRELKDK